ncbi:MAG TPA: ABC transporter ATP-binding protein [Candidatus Fimenecus stercoravium]|nr:ABC transporter ATP-binding protein [Candidatus Fimenecus stercoravium]
MRKYYMLYKKEFILGPACKLTEAILELLVPLVMARIVDVGVQNGDVPYILKMGGLMVLLGAAGLGFAVICQYCAAVAQQGVGTALRRDLLHKIHTLSSADRAQFSNATLITRITNDVNQIQSGVAMLIRLVFRSPFLIAGSLIMAMALDLRMSVIFFIAGFLVSGIMYYVLSRSLPLYKKIQKKLDGLLRITGENLSGVRVIRAFVRQAHETKRFADGNEALTRVCMRVAKLNAYLNPLTFAVINLGIAALLVFGGFKVNAGSLTQGEIIALTNYMTQILLSIIVFANVIVVFTKAGASIDRVKEVLAAEPTMHEGTEETFDENAPAVEVRHVDFSFAGSEEKLLSNIDFTIERGETVGIIGGTGAGKSVLVNLLMRLHDVTGGEVRIFGRDVRNCTFTALRGAVHIVSQGSRLFQGTVRENLLCGKRDISDEALRQALRIAQCSEFVDKLPEGLDAPVEEGGKNFSGGQRQRLCVARALVGDPEILIFDDSSSALDYATDANMRSAVSKELRGKTVLYVAQRVSTVRNADKIILLDDGEVRGIGTHQALYTENELYREICDSQLSESEAVS